MTGFWHVRDELLDVGSELLPRFGKIVKQKGIEHPHFDREQQFETVRKQLGVSVSRLECTYAFDRVDLAVQWAKGDDRQPQYVYEVQPSDPSAPCIRADMLWLTWWREARTEIDRRRCALSYWQQQSTNATNPAAKSSWELLIGCSLLVVSVVGMSFAMAASSDPPAAGT